MVHSTRTLHKQKLLIISIFKYCEW